MKLLICSYKSLAGKDSMLFRKQIRKNNGQVYLVSKNNRKLLALSEEYIGQFVIKFQCYTEINSFKTVFEKWQIILLSIKDKNYVISLSFYDSFSQKSVSFPMNYLIKGIVRQGKFYRPFKI